MRCGRSARSTPARSLSGRCKLRVGKLRFSLCQNLGLPPRRPNSSNERPARWVAGGRGFFQALVNLLLGRRGIRHILPPPRLAPRNREFPPECAVNIVLPIKPPLLSDDPDTEIAI